MLKRNFMLVASALFLACLAASFFIALHTPSAFGSATIWTDKPDYSYWETVSIFGSGFNPNTNIFLTIARPDLVVEAHSTTSASSGNFIYYYVLDGMLGTYTVTATDGTNTATTTFTESPLVVDFKQYATKSDTWINSILQSSNSIYHEGMSVPQRVLFTNIQSTSGDVHTLTLSHQATKSGIHAYDWLTGWNQGNVPPLGYTPWGNDIGPPASLATICQTLHLGTNESYVDVPDDAFISKDGSTQARINAYEAAWGNRQIRISGNQPITSAGFSATSHDVADGGDTGDSFILYTLTWTSASNQILIELSGHLAMSGNPAVNPIAWGVGLGSSQIAGGPYHFKLDKLDGGSLGSQDNQIKGADILIPPGHIIVHKTTVPAGDPADFTFDPDYQVSNFVLSDGEQYDSGDVVPGTYHVQELALAGWDLTGLTVTDPDLGSSVNLGTGTATIDLDAGETVHVHFTNTKRGKIIVDKITVPASDPQSFTFTPSWGSAFGLTDAGTPVDSGWLVPGSYSVTETVPTGWGLTSVTLDGVPFTNGGSISLAAGQIRYVNFTDTKIVTPVGKIIVDKVTVPASDPQSFGFTLTGGPDSISQSFSLTDMAAPHDSGWIKPGTYAVSETVPAGWVLTSAVCSDGSPVNSIILDPGETVTVTFTDTKIGISVGGEWVSVDKTRLLLPWVVSASLMTVTVISFVSVKRIRKRRN